MNAAPHTGSPRKQLRAARAMASFATAYASQMDQEFMTKIKKARIGRKDVKNEGTSGDMYENKVVSDKMAENASGFWSDKCIITR